MCIFSMYNISYIFYCISLFEIKSICKPGFYNLFILLCNSNYPVLMTSYIMIINTNDFLAVGTDLLLFNLFIIKIFNLHCWNNNKFIWWHLIKPCYQLVSSSGIFRSNVHVVIQILIILRVIKIWMEW